MTFFDGDDESEIIPRFGDPFQSPPPTTAAGEQGMPRPSEPTPPLQSEKGTFRAWALWGKSMQGRAVLGVVGLVVHGWFARHYWQRGKTKRAFYYTFAAGESYGRLKAAADAWTKSYKRSISR